MVLSCIIGCHRNHEISYNQNAFIFWTVFFFFAFQWSHCTNLHSEENVLGVQCRSDYHLGY